MEASFRLPNSPAHFLDEPAEFSFMRPAREHTRLGALDRPPDRLALVSRYTDEDQLLERSLAHARATFGPEAAATAEVMEELADTYFEGKNFRRARELQQAALAIWVKLEGPGHAKAAHLRQQLGMTCHALGDHLAGELHIRQSLEIYGKIEERYRFEKEQEGKRRGELRKKKKLRRKGGRRAAGDLSDRSAGGSSSQGSGSGRASFRI